MSSERIQVQVSVDATDQKVWDYFTQPEHITQWNFASPEWCCPSAENDLRIGGAFSYRMEARDGSIGFDFKGVYHEVNPLLRIKYTLEDGREVSVDLERKDGALELTEAFEPENENTHELQQAGWQAILNNFKSYVENN